MGKSIEEFLNEYNDYIVPRSSALVDNNITVFKYGLSQNPNNEYEEPTYLGFSIELDQESALFKDTEIFMNRYKNHSDISARIPLYFKVKDMINMVFNSQESATNLEYVKQHYINSISGLQSLTKKYVEYKEDKLTIEMHEDISLFSSYLAMAYNNLIFSYDSGRTLIPENLLYFNMYIKISEIRNFTSIQKLVSDNEDDIKIVQALKNNTTCMIYKLTDCLFNFFEATPFGDSISQAGIDTPNPGHSIVTFDVYFKRVNLIFNAPLIKNSISFNNMSPNLGLKVVEPTKEETPMNTESVETNDRIVLQPRDVSNKDLERNVEPDPKTKLKKIFNNTDNNIILQNKIFTKGKKNPSTNTSNEIEDSNNYGMYTYNENLDAIINYNMSLDETEENKQIDEVDEEIKPEVLTKKEKRQQRKSDRKSKRLQKKEARLDAKYAKSEKEESESINAKKISNKWNDIRSINNAVSAYYNKGKGYSNDFITDKLGNTGLGNVANGVANQVGDAIFGHLQKLEKLAMQKKNEMLNKFLNETKAKTKVLLDYNVYTDEKDPNSIKDELSSVYTAVGNNVMDQIINGLKDGTNTNITGIGNTGNGL